MGIHVASAGTGKPGSSTRITACGDDHPHGRGHGDPENEDHEAHSKGQKMAAWLGYLAGSGRAPDVAGEYWCC